MSLNSADRISAAKALRDVISGTDDPTVVAKRGDIGTLYIRKGTAALYQKQDSGLTTNWTLVGAGGGGPTTVSRPSALVVGDVGKEVAIDPATGNVVLCDQPTLGPLTEMQAAIRVRGAAIAATGAPSTAQYDIQFPGLSNFGLDGMQTFDIGADSLNLTSEGQGTPDPSVNPMFQPSFKENGFSGNPADGENFTVFINDPGFAGDGGSETFTFRNAPALPTDIQIGGSLNATLNNAAAVINAIIGDADYTNPDFQANGFGGIPVVRATVGLNILTLEQNYVNDMMSKGTWLPASDQAIEIDVSGAPSISTGSGNFTDGGIQYLGIEDYDGTGTTVSGVRAQPSPWWMAESMASMFNTFWNTTLNSDISSPGTQAGGASVERSVLIEDASGGATAISPNTMTDPVAGFDSPNTTFVGGMVGSPGTEITIETEVDGGGVVSITLVAGTDFAVDPDPAIQAANIQAAIAGLGGSLSAAVAADNAVIVTSGPVAMPDAATNSLSVEVTGTNGGNIVRTLLTEDAATRDLAELGRSLPCIGTLVSVAGGVASVGLASNVREISNQSENLRAGEGVVSNAGEPRAADPLSEAVSDVALETGGVGADVLVYRRGNVAETEDFTQYEGDYAV